MREYRIAFMTADWNYELVESTLHGLKQLVDERDNVRLFIFDCFGKDIGNAKDWSEYSVFDLADMSQFDGVLVQGNQIVLEPVRQRLARRIAEAGIPAVTIDCPLEGCVLISMDNQLAQQQIVDHVIRAHGARRLVYLTGILGNGCPEGQQRLDGFLAACRENGLTEADYQVLQCTWRTSDGMDAADRWADGQHPLPDAFICANDEMALGLIEGLEKYGYRIPRDTIVTGFDNLTSAELSRPRLSTVHRDTRRMNYQALRTLIDMIDGTEYRSFIPFRHEIVCSESCGCREAALPDYIREKYFQQTRFLKNFYTLQDSMAEALFDASTLPELLDIVQRNHRIFGCESVYLCINDYYFDSYDKKQWNRSSERFAAQMVLAACGTDAPVNGGPLYTRFPTRQLLPRELLERHRFLMFYPLHYNTYSIGYLVMDGISQAAKLNLHESILSFLEIAIENVRKKGLLRQLNDVLDNLYVQDALTGLYNRFGFERYGKATFDGFMAAGDGVQVLFIDMDDMKGINDRYGHEAGDAAIRITAEALKSVCGEEDFVMRYGGDEFLAIVSGRRENLAEAVQRAVDERSAKELPCPLKLSIGIVRADTEGVRTLDDCVRRADALMYEIKAKGKAQRQ